MYVTSEGAVSDNVLYYQQLSIARYQPKFYANNSFHSFSRCGASDDGPPNTLVLHYCTQLFPTQSGVPAQGVHIGGLWSTSGTVTLSRCPKHKLARCQLSMSETVTS